MKSFENAVCFQIPDKDAGYLSGEKFGFLSLKESPLWRPMRESELLEIGVSV